MNEQTNTTEKLKSFAASAASMTKKAAALAKKQTERKKITTVDLPQVHYNLGKELETAQSLPPDAKVIQQRIHALRDEISAINNKEYGPSGTFSEKAKRTAAVTADAAQKKMIEGKIASAFRSLGKTVDDNGDSSFGSVEIMNRLKSLKERIATLDSEIEELSRDSEGRWVTPKRVVIASVGVIGLLIVSFVIPNGDKGLHELTEADRTIQADPKSSEETGNQSTRVSGNNKRNFDTLQSITSGPIIFSNHARYLFFPAETDETYRIWDIQSNCECVTDAKNTNLPFPAVFSEDGTTLVSMDGDILREFSIETNVAQEYPLPHDSVTRIRNVGQARFLLEREGYPRERFVALFNDGSLRKLWPPEKRGTSTRAWLLSDANTNLEALCASSDGKRLAIVYRKVTRTTSPQWIFSVRPSNDVSKILQDIVLDGKVVSFDESSFSTCQSRDDLYPFKTKYSRSGHVVALPLVEDVTKNQKAKKRIAIFNASDLSMIATITVPTHEHFCFSDDGTKFAVAPSSSTQVSNGTRWNSHVDVFNCETGKQLLSHRLGAVTLKAGRRHIQQIRFEDNSNQVVVLEKLGEEWSNEFNQSHVDWKVSSIQISDGQELLLVHGTTASVPNPSQQGATLELSLDSRLLTARWKKRSLIWGLDELVGINNLLEAADQHWDGSELLASAQKYEQILSNPLARQVPWISELRLTELYSRCVDGFAETSSGKALDFIDKAEREGIKLNLTTASASKLFLQRRQQVAAKLQEDREKQRVAHDKQVDEIRAKNKAASVKPSQITKQQFVDAMKRVMSDGRIDDFVCVARFRNFALTDTFGEPDTNHQIGDDFKRLYSYRCKDGIVQLQVLYGGEPGFVVVNEINFY